ncbi:MAG: hypothetical protein V1799_14550 [bacterium]
MYKIHSPLPIEFYGTIVEPQEGIINKILNSDVRARPSLATFSYTANMTRMLPLSSTGIVYSQRHPYRMMMLDLKSHSEQEFTMPVSFSTTSRFDFQSSLSETSFGVKLKNLPSGKLIGIAMVGNYLLAVVTDAEGKESIIDYYNRNGEHTARLALPTLPYDHGYEYKCAVIGPDSSVYILIQSKYLTSWIEKYKIEYTI